MLAALPPARCGAQALADVRRTARASAISSSTRRERQVELHRLAGAPAHRLKRAGKEVFDSVIVVTDRRILDEQIQRHHQAVHAGGRDGRATPSIPATCASSSRRARRSSSPRCRSSPSSSTRSATKHRATDASPSSSTRRTPARAARPRRHELEEASGQRTRHGQRRAEKRMDARKMLTNASYFAFTATPKNKTLEMFGEAVAPTAAR
jgi:type I restriction enzyme R subunit